MTLFSSLSDLDFFSFRGLKKKKRTAYDLHGEWSLILIRTLNENTLIKRSVRSFSRFTLEPHELKRGASVSTFCFILSYLDFFSPCPLSSLFGVLLTASEGSSCHI